MPKETVNRRVQFTKTALRDAMIELICEKPLTSITVKDVCARADINRSTFYLHYKGMWTRCSSRSRTTRSSTSSPTSRGWVMLLMSFVGFLTYMKNTPRLRNLFFVLAGERGDHRFTRRLQKLTFQTFERRWLEHPPNSGLDDEKTLCLFLYVQPGIVSVFYSWLTDKNAEHVGGAAGLSAPEAHTARRDRSRRGSVPVRQQPDLTFARCICYHRVQFDFLYEIIYIIYTPLLSPDKSIWRLPSIVGL